MSFRSGRRVSTATPLLVHPVAKNFLSSNSIIELRLSPRLIKEPFLNVLNALFSSFRNKALGIFSDTSYQALLVPKE